MNDTKFLTVPEVAAVLRRKQSTIRAWLFRDATFPRIKVGRGILIPKDQLEAWINRQQPPPLKRPVVDLGSAQ
jgi:excisionase family DNA binding protein